MIEIIAEIGSVHDGSFGNACKLIDLAAECGADTAKFQTHLAAAETLKNAPSPAYFKGEDRFSYFNRTGFTPEQWKKLKEHCDSRGIQFLSSPFSLEAVDLLESIGAERFKVPSGEVSNLPLMIRLAKTGKPVILSSGMSNWAELDAAVAILKPAVPLTVMQCTSAYPCPPEQVGLNVIVEMQKRWGVPVGYSDHTTGDSAAFAAAAMGATMFEKHLTYSKKMYGSDAANAMEAFDFARYCRGLKEIGEMLANPVDKNDLAPFTNMKMIFEKSIVTARPLEQGQVIVEDDLAFKKPGDGIPAAHWKTLIGKKAKHKLDADHKFSLDDVA